jgi:hypothetical protein
MKRQRRLPATIDPSKSSRLTSFFSQPATGKEPAVDPVVRPPAVPATEIAGPVSYLELPRWVSIVYCISYEQCQACCTRIARAVALHTSDDLCVCGFDLEWRVMFKAGKQRPVALMQLFFGMEVFLFHLYAFKDRGLPPELISLLADPRLIKTGLNINNDIAKMERDFPLLAGVVRGVCDLRTVSKACEFAICNRQLDADIENDPGGLPSPVIAAAKISWPAGSLDTMVEKTSQLVQMSVVNLRVANSYRFHPGACTTVSGLHLPAPSVPQALLLSKPGQVRCGNWEAWPLGPEQREYAAMDAFASFLVFHCLNKLFVQCHLVVAAMSASAPEYSAAIPTSLADFNKIVRNVLVENKYGHPPPLVQPEVDSVEGEEDHGVECAVPVTAVVAVPEETTHASPGPCQSVTAASFAIELTVPLSPCQYLL